MHRADPGCFALVFALLHSWLRITKEQELQRHEATAVMLEVARRVGRGRAERSRAGRERRC